MSKINKGEIIEAKSTRTGFTANGNRYVFFKTNNGKDCITIFSSNPDMQIVDGDTLRIVDIETVSHTIQQQNGKFYNNTNVVAKLERAARAEDNKRQAELNEMSPYDVSAEDMENLKKYEFGK